MACPSDHLWGPRVDERCRAFDFTLFFEDSVLGCVPPAIFLFLVPFELYQARRQPVRVHEARWVTVKLGLCVVLLSLQMACLVLRLDSSGLQTRATLPSGLLSLASIVGAALLSCWQHRHSWRPSLLLGLYLPVALLCDAARARTLWLESSSSRIPGTFTAATSFLALLLILEERRKTVTTSEAQAVTQEIKSGIWDRSFFVWLLPIFKQGFRGLLTVDNLPEVDADLRADVLYHKLSTSLMQYDLTRPHALLQATFRAFLPALLAGIIPRLLLLALTFAQPFLVSATISYVENGGSQHSSEPAMGKALIGAFALVYTGIAVATALYMRQAFRFNLRIRGALDALIYRHTTSRKSQQVENERTAMTLMGTDVERIVSGLRDVHELWASTVSIAIATWLLERQLSGACVVPLLLAAAGFLAAAWVSSRSNTGQKHWIEKVQTRLHWTAEMLHNMKTVKMLGLNSLASQTIEHLLRIEIETSEAFRRLVIWQIFLCMFPRLSAVTYF
ncbi:hypothetical protein BDV11DRAFT_176289 [Aspergillus similis]